MKISIIIPTFNRSALVERAVECALNQTHKDREVIVVDDGSTDDTAVRLRRFGDQIRYLYQENRGASAAQNRGIEAASGEWIAVLASDDVWLPTKLERQLEALDESGQEFGACFTDCRYCGDTALRKTAFERAQLKSDTAFRAIHDPLKYVMAKHPAFYVQSLLVRKSLLNVAGRFREDLRVGEDTDLLFRLTFLTRFCVIKDPLVEIDRSASLERLTDLFRAPDQSYPCIERRLNGWLGMPQVVEARLRKNIYSQLRSLYYAWAVASFYQLNFAAAWNRLNLIRAHGQTRWQIGRHLCYKAGSRSLSIITPGKEVYGGK